MKTIGIFCTYLKNESIPDYVKIYITTLRPHFTDFIIVMNKTQLPPWETEFLTALNVKICVVHNEGYDFGMYYKVIEKFDCSTYDHVGFINDSMVLFKPLHKTFNTYYNGNYDYFGMVSSPEKKIHIQSYFLLMNKKTFAIVHEYMKTHGIQDTKESVVDVYEVNMCTHLLSHKLKLGSLFNHQILSATINPTIYKANELIKLGMPMVKKSLISNSSTGGLRSFLNKNGLVLDLEAIKNDPDLLGHIFDYIMIMYD